MCHSLHIFILTSIEQSITYLFLPVTRCLQSLLIKNSLFIPILNFQEKKKKLKNLASHYDVDIVNMLCGHSIGHQ